MSKILIKSTKEKEKIKSLLKELPNYRQAYSDRTSWLMAFISELTYIKFNPIFKDSTKDYFLKTVSELVSDNKMKSLKRLIELVGYNADIEMENLKKSVELLNLKLFTEWLTP